ncbi:MAG: LPS assembly lipoprotein LptE [Ignavibacteria bacterium]|nr:LPS assembly lipoprotein LptE [Ignavibacteria bacterium]
MNFFSSLFNHIVSKKFISLLFFILTIGCYSFKGGSLPDHIKTISFAPIIDNSNYGNPIYRDMFVNNLLKKFQSDNSLKVIEGTGDSKLTVTINSIRDETAFVKPGELEKERKITMEVTVEFFDAVKGKSIFNRKFSNYAIYSVAGIPFSRDKAIEDVISKLTEDILLATVSGW